MKKISFIVLALLLGMAQSAWADTTGSWANYSDDSWGSDYSTSDNFTVSTAAQLAKFASMVNEGKEFRTNFGPKTITLAADIDLGAHFWTPIGGRGSVFKGIFKGEGHTISGMYINESRSYNGLFGYIDDDAKIRDIKITNSQINANSDFTGAIVGLADRCRIENCSVASSVKITSTAAQSGDGITPIATGGLVGKMTSSAALRGCVCGASVQGTEKVGGLVGEVDCATVVACIYTGSIVNGGSSSTQAAMFGNIISSGTGVEDYLPHNLYINSALDGKNGRDKRGYVISTSSGFTFDFGSPAEDYNVSGISRYTYQNYPFTDYFMLVLDGTMYCTANQRIRINISAPIGYVPTNVTASAGTITDKGNSRYELYTADVSSDINISANSQLTAWDGDGTGTETDPYLVKTPDDLRWISVYSNAQNTDHYEGKFFQLANDIEFDDTENNFTPIARSSTASYYFAGTFDGQNHTISGINMSSDGRQGLFGTIAGATIKNLTLSASTFTMTTNNSIAGGIVAYIQKGAKASTIENCHVTGDVSIDTKGHTGGIVGFTENGETVIQGCTSAASILLRNNNLDIGGIIGYCGYEGTDETKTLRITVSNCLYYGNSLSADTNTSGRIGGIFGGYYSNGNNGGYSTVIFSNNYYTYPDASVKGVGQETVKSGDNTTTQSNLDLTANYAAARARTVSASDDIADMGDVGTPVEGGITPYTFGIKFGDAYYSHVFALDNAGDYTTALQAYDGQTFNVKLRGRRLFKDDSWNTICLPFNLTYFTNTIFLGDNCEVREMDTERSYGVKVESGQEYPYKTGCNDGRLYLFFKKIINNLAAGTPYIVKWDKVDGYNELQPDVYDYVNPMFTNVTIVGGEPTAVKSKDGKVSFVPTYTPFNRDYADRSVLFVGAANRLYYPNGAGNASVKSFRAYFQLNGVQIAADPSGNNDDDDDDEYIPEGGGNVKAFVLDIEEDATGINEELKMKSEEPTFIFNIAGQRLNKMQKGINIVNGKKKVIGK